MPPEPRARRPVGRSDAAAWPGAARAADRVAGLAGWRRWLLLFVAGALGALALPPFHWVPLILAPLVALAVLVARAKGPAQAFAAGWWIGFGHFAAGTYWVAEAFLVDAARFGWMIPPMVGGLAAYLALFVAAAAALTAALPFSGTARILVLALAWVGFEWVRGWLFTGFPWNLIGYVWAFADPMNQLAAYVGIWGLSLVTAIAGAMPALLAEPGARPRAVAGVAGAALLLAAVWAGGALRLAAAPDMMESATRLRLVQPAIEQSLKNDPAARLRNLELTLDLTRTPPTGAPFQHVIWPEAAAPFLLEREPELRRALAGILPPSGYLITGAPRAEPLTGDLAQIWNSLVLIDAAGAIRASFDKFHLVPLGEYVPLRDVFPFISKLTPGGMDFSAGPGPRTLRVAGLPPFGAMICYEAIFPHRVADEDDRPDWLVNLTNDAWFGTSTGPYQHFATARLRAVEEGLPLVRVANSGVSGVIDSYGRVKETLPLGARGQLDLNLPLPIPQTIFARYGAWTSLACGSLILVLALALQRRWNRAESVRQ